MEYGAEVMALKEMPAKVVVEDSVEFLPTNQLQQPLLLQRKALLLLVAAVVEEDIDKVVMVVLFVNPITNLVLQHALVVLHGHHHLFVILGVVLLLQDKHQAISKVGMEIKLENNTIKKLMVVAAAEVM